MTRALSTALSCVLALAVIACDEGGLDGEGGAGGSAGASPDREPDPTGGRRAPDDDDDDAAVDAGELDASAPMTCGPRGECDLRSIDSCGEGMGCVLLRTGGASDEDAGASDEDGGASSFGPMCVATGEGRDGDACTGLHACGAGLDCTAEQGGVCRRYCCELNTTSGCPSGQFCRVELRDDTGTSTGAALCDACDACDVLGSDCPQGQGCYPLAASSAMCNACLPTGERAPDDSCLFSNDCEAGSACVELSGQRRCVELCALDEAQCAGGRACVGAQGEPFGEGVGLCVANER